MPGTPAHGYARLSLRPSSLPARPAPRGNSRLAAQNPSGSVAARRPEVTGDRRMSRRPVLRIGVEPSRAENAGRQQARPRAPGASAGPGYRERPRMIPCMASCSSPFVATTEPSRESKGSPAMVETLPPASVTISALPPPPCPTDAGAAPRHQKPSNRPVRLHVDQTTRPRQRRVVGPPRSTGRARPSRAAARRALRPRKRRTARSPRPPSRARRTETRCRSSIPSTSVEPVVDTRNGTPLSRAPAPNSAVKSSSRIGS